MTKHKLLFFLDYGFCFWGAGEDSASCGGISNEDLPLSDYALCELEKFLKEYDAFYSLGLPPYEEHDVPYCKRFNRELRRITNLVFPELAAQFVICMDQLELTESAELLKRYRESYSEVKEEQKQFYNVDITI